MDVDVRPSVRIDRPRREVAIRATGSPGRFFGWATPLLRRQVRRSIGADLDRLRACLEQGSGARR